MRNSMRLSSGTPALRSDHGVLHFDRAAHRVDHAAELDDRAVAGALDHPALVHGDGGIDQIAAQRPEPRERPLLVGAGEPRKADDVGSQNRRRACGSRSRRASGASTKANSTKTRSAMLLLRLREAINPPRAKAGMVRFGHLARHRGERPLLRICAIAPRWRKGRNSPRTKPLAR